MPSRHGQLRSAAARLRSVRSQIVALQTEVCAWYVRAARTFPWRAHDASLYELVLAELLLQRTRADQVAAHLPGLTKRYPNWAHLANASQAELELELQPLGLWRRRAVALRAFAAELCERDCQYPSSRTALENMTGVGQYVASAILLFCHGHSEPLLDVNMARVLERCFGPRKLADIRFDPWLQTLSRAVVQHPSSRIVNWGILDIAAMHCLVTAPRCTTCPLRLQCRTNLRQSGRRNKHTYD